MDIIKGLSVGIGTMEVGEVSRFMIHSKMAFGEKFYYPGVPKGW